MKKITLLLLTLLIALSLSVPALAANPAKVVDNADLMSDEEEAALLSELNTLYEKQQFDVVVVTVTDLEGKSAMAYADDYYDYNGYGYGDSHDGCLLLIKVASESDREYWISTTGYGITALTDYGIEYIGEEIVPSMKRGDYYKAASDFASTVDSFVTKAREGEPVDIGNKPADANLGKSLGTSFIIALIIALIVTFSIKSKYKPVRFNRGAANYLVDGSLNVTGQYDNFLYSNVTRTKIESDSSSGGSSTHSGSSGTSHGGGGGSF